jgi:hypothetical protein
MTIQALKDIVLANGMTIKAGAVLNVPDKTGAALIEQGAARLRTPPGPTEHKSDDDPRLLPGDPLPPAVPYVRVPTTGTAGSFDPGAYEDQDNFVTNMVTLTAPFGGAVPSDAASSPDPPPPPVTPSDSASGRTPLASLDEIKLHCHIEADQTAEDSLLTQYEMAARIHAEKYLRYPLDADAPNGVGENIKQACLMLIAHWYRNREAVSTGRGYMGFEMPLGFEALLGVERDYPVY